MRERLWIPVLLLLASVWPSMCSCWAQSGAPTDILQRGNLTVWIVAGAPLASPKTPALDYAKYHEQAAGSFGQNAGSTGQTAGSYGQTSGSFGTSAGNVGRTAGSVGQSAGSFGQDVGDIGQTAGSYGQSAGDPIGTPGSATMQAETTAARGIRGTVGAWVGVTEQLHRDYPDLRLQVFTVDGAEVRGRLTAYTGKADYPDVLLGDGLTRGEENGSLRDVSLRILGEDRVSGRLVVNGTTLVSSTPLALRRALHPGEARAFLFWLDERTYCGACTPGRVEDAAVTPASIAVGAVQTLLGGGSLGAEADPAFAQVGGETARRMTLLGNIRTAPEGAALRIEVRSATANDKLAVVSLRVTANSLNAFGVLHPAVVLRRGADRRWRVLQISADIRMGETDPSGALHDYTKPVAQEKLKPVTAVTLAAPLDGDTRSGQPELWWDDPGDAGLLAVEWQTRGEGSWSDTHLQFISDHEARLQVRVPATFAHAGEEYRWRVWSVGDGGMVALSPWRRVTVLH